MVFMSHDIGLTDSGDQRQRVQERRREVPPVSPVGLVGTPVFPDQRVLKLEDLLFGQPGPVVPV